MKLIDLVEDKQMKESGTYVGLKFSDKTIDSLKKYIEDNDIPNHIPYDEFHATLIYSRKTLKDFSPEGKLNPSWKGNPKELEIFKTRDGNNALVLRYTCKKQVDRHHYIMDEFDATYDFPEYKVHLTLSYDCGDLDLKKLSPVSDIGKIEIVKEYDEPLDLDKYKKNKDKKD